MSGYTRHIEGNPRVMPGKTVIKGTRITVQTIIGGLAAGYSYKDVLKAHQHITKVAILAALRYTSAILKNEQIRFN